MHLSFTLIVIKRAREKVTHSLFVISYGTSKHCSNKIMAFGITVIDVIIKHRTALIAIKINREKFTAVQQQNQFTCDKQHQMVHEK